MKKYKIELFYSYDNRVTLTGVSEEGLTRVRESLSMGHTTSLIDSSGFEYFIMPNTLHFMRVTEDKGLPF